MFTKDQAKKLYPMYKKDIEESNSDQDWNAPETGRNFDGSVHFPEDVGTLDNTIYVRGYERYYKKHISEYRIFESFSGKEDLLDEKKFEAYAQKPAFIIQGNIITDPKQAQALVQQLQQQEQMRQMQESMQMEAQMKQRGLGADAVVPEPSKKEIQVEEITFADLIEKGVIEVVKFYQQKYINVLL